MAFSFGFSGDDIDFDDSEVNNGVTDVLPPKNNVNSLPELLKPSKHDINDWVSEAKSCRCISFCLGHRALEIVLPSDPCFWRRNMIS